MSTIYDWSLWEDSNESIDELITWTEGQAPSTVNNSARAMMQRIREYITDTSGALVSVTTNHDETKTTEITLQSKSPHKQYIDGLFLRFKADKTNLGETTLSLNGMLARPVFTAQQEGYISLLAGMIQKDCIYEVVYAYQDQGANMGHWILLNATHMPSDPFVVPFMPIGSISAFATQHVPSGWLLCDGSEVSRAEYKKLLDVIGLSYGIGDGVNTFNLPDYRGVFLRGFDYGRGLDRNREFGTIQSDEVRHHMHAYKMPSIFEEPDSRRVQRIVDVYTYDSRDEIPEEDQWDGSDYRAALDIELANAEERKQLQKHLRAKDAERKSAESNLKRRGKRDLSNEEIEHLCAIKHFGGTLVKEMKRLVAENPDRMEQLLALRELMEHDHNVKIMPAGGAETRPKNACVAFGIKY